MGLRVDRTKSPNFSPNATLHTAVMIATSVTMRLPPMGGLDRESSMWSNEMVISTIRIAVEVHYVCVEYVECCMDSFAVRGVLLWINLRYPTSAQYV